MAKSGSTWLAVVIGISIAATLPAWLTNQYFLHVLIVVCVFSVGALGVRLMLLAGHSNFGQAGFMAIGAYSSDILASKLVGMPVWGSMLVGGLVAATFGALIGFPALRVRGIYFSILTLAMGSAVRELILLNPFGLTGAPRQFSLGIAPPEPINLIVWRLDFSTKSGAYLLALAMLLIALAVMHRLDSSRVGLLVRSLSQNEILAQSLGVHAVALKVVAFCISCFLAGIAGAFYTHYLLYADADLLGLWTSVYLVIYVVLGGTRYVFGPLVGSFCLVVLVELLRDLPFLPDNKASAIEAVAYAILLIGMIFLAPRGLLSIVETVRTNLAISRPKPLTVGPELEASQEAIK